MSGKSAKALRKIANMASQGQPVSSYEEQPTNKLPEYQNGVPVKHTSQVVLKEECARIKYKRLKKLFKQRQQAGLIGGQR